MSNLPGADQRLGPLLHRKEIPAERQLQRDLVREDGMIAVHDRAGNLDRLARGVDQVHPALRRLHRLAIGHGDFERPVFRGVGERGEQQE